MRTRLLTYLLVLCMALVFTTGADWRGVKTSTRYPGGISTGALAIDVTNAGTSTTVTLTKADTGGVFINNTQRTEYDLPADPTDLTFNFVVGSNTTLSVDPNGSDQIILETADGGYYYYANALGESLIIKGISTTQWAVMSEVGTWTDGG